MQDTEESIQQMKQKLNEIIGKRNSRLGDEEVLKLSRKLDELINTYLEQYSK